MSAQKKFGTFSGVLTPSLLTILGVIMYMRLGTVVGYSSQIFEFILIIVFAHLISVTTGLSVSSISTDKKIEKGGIYYMLTRSLGLPIGGAIGLTIFVATALSISLYLIGFAESLIPVLGFEIISVNELRLFGTLALLLVLTIAYISTSFALKIQYVILGLIVLSLVSIFLGSSENVTIGTNQLENPSFSVLFGIFFPAVTGFTAGVAMSGDLKNPRISIPWGTLLSILIGFVVYVTLAIFIFYNIDSSVLQSNNNALIEFGAIPLLVIGGVWGATLSSALGGILGGPRILQAMSLDRITPKVFSKGYGINNEPRNALFLTFFIAELGILIGELNVIAELVAMFYMAAYLFINVSCFLEQWSSPDFRPKFKIPIWVSLTGAVSTFLLMIQLNLAATLIAVIVMLIVFLWLSRKDLVLGTGDVWISVWTSIVKTGLKNLYKKSAHKRNWQPNILLFSGGSNNRPHLIEFSKSISGRGGMVSNFDLIEQKSADILFPKSNQIVKDNQIEDDSIFHRRLYCQNTFQGIESIANTYGFSGIDPNTVLMGWAKNTKDPLWFAQMTNKLNLLDYNLLYLDYDKKKGFGEYASIDLWWTNFSKENELGLQLIKFLKNSKGWKNATIRLCYVNNKKDVLSSDIDKINRLIDRMRLPINLELINNYIERKSINDLVMLYSFNADLIIMDLPKLNDGQEKTFVKQTNELLNNLGSTLFIDASSKFIVEDKAITKIVIDEKQTLPSRVKASGKLFVTDDKTLDNFALKWQQGLHEINIELVNKIKAIYLSQVDFYDDCFKHSKVTNELLTELKDSSSFILFNEAFEQSIYNSIEIYFSQINVLIEDSPGSIRFKWNEKMLDKNIFINGRLNRKKQKILKNLKNDNIVFSNRVNVIKVINHHLKHGFTDGFSSIMLSVGYFALTHHQQFKLSITNDAKGKSYKKDVVNKLDHEFDLIHSMINNLSDKFVNSVLKDTLHLNNRTISNNREENFNPSVYKKKWNEVLNFSYWMNTNNHIIHQQKILNVSSLIFNATVTSKIDSITQNVKKDLINPLSNYANQAIKLIASKDLTQLNELVKVIEKDLISINESYLEKYDSFDLQNELISIPDELNVYSSKTLNGFQLSQRQLPVLSIYPQSTFLSIYRKEIDPLIKNLIKDEFQWFKKHMDIILNALQLAVFTSQNQSDNKILKEVVEKALLSAHEIIREYELTVSRFEISVNKLKDTLQKVSQVDFILLNNTKKSQLVNTKSSSGVVFKLKEIQQIFSEKIVTFLNIVSPKIDSQYQKGFSNKMDELRFFVDSVSIDEEVANRIPSFYSQLFSGYHQPNDFYASFIKSELDQMDSALAKMDSYKPNVLVVSGSPLSGKSYLINQFLHKHSKIEKKHIYPPKDLEFDKVENVIPSLYVDFIEEKHNIKSLNDLPTGSVVVLDDFELWWRKSDKGFDKINQWISIFKEYSNNILFIVECNHFLLSLMLKVSKLEDVLIQIVETPYFSGKQAGKVIDYKNKLSNQLVTYKGLNINARSFISNFFLFNQLSELSGGNIGGLNLVWMSSLVFDDENSLKFDPDFDLEFPLIESADEKIILLMIIIHKKLSKDDLGKILSHMSAEQINRKIGLLDSNKLILIESNYIVINPVVLPYLVKYFKGKGVLKP
jgi:amino acid transporter